MNADCVKLTTYFGERHRTERGLVADELLDLYGRRAVQVSLLLRGAEGFGRKHHLRTDRLLTLSEDLPIVSVALDTRARIEALLDELMSIKRHGLVTLERARLLVQDSAAADVPEELDEATKLTIYVGRQERAQREPAFTAICELLHRRGIAGATVLLGVDGTLRGQRERARFFGRNANVPLMIIAVGSGSRIAAVLPELAALLTRPLFTLERVQVLKRDGELLSRPREIAPTDPSGLPVWQKLMVYTSEQAKYRGSPVHVALVRALREERAAGATSLRGIWGFHGDHAPHGDRLLQIRRHVPVVTIVIDSPHRIGRAFDVIDQVTCDTGLVTGELVPAAADVQEAASVRPLRLARTDPFRMGLPAGRSHPRREDCWGSGATPAPAVGVHQRRPTNVRGCIRPGGAPSSCAASAVLARILGRRRELADVAARRQPVKACDHRRSSRRLGSSRRCRA